MNKHWADRLISYKTFSDRIGVALFRLGRRSYLKVVNVYAPTQQRAKADKKVRDLFYDQLEAIVAETSAHTSLFIAGDFNAKIGQDWTDTRCIGRFCRGYRNQNGQHLAEFCDSFDLVATNTCFDHRASHRTTWQGQRLDAQTGKTVPIYNQIDYILVPRRQLNLVLNARSYSGTLTDSDHRLVVTTTQIPPSFKRKFGKTPTTSHPKYYVNLLARDQDKCQEYQSRLNEKVQYMQTNNALTAFDKWVELRKKITETANETVGTVKKRNNKPECPLIQRLSNQQHQLRIQISNTSCQNARQQLKARRNKILEEIKERQRNSEAKEIEIRTTEINNLKDGARMFRAVKELTSAKPNTLIIKNEAGETIAQPKEAAEAVACYFHKLFFNQTPTTSNYPQLPKAGKLNSPISTIEVCNATKKLRNGRAIGPDGIPGELLKYSDKPVHAQMAKIFNEMFEKGQDLELGKGTLIVIP
jgi:hypothetical protein